ncbi:MAG: hypothetical protein DRI71_10520 [Bacteroidetes bacterium]|nr:MAG: hypothetical protein DRI71_10520 [Bacteroidota bacterium]
MEKKRKVIQVYAIVVNVVAVITFIIAATSFISAIIDRSDPFYGGYSQVDLSSFQKYKMDVLKSTTKDGAYIPTDEAIQEMYDAAKADRINKVMHQSFRTMIVSGVIIGIAIILFGSHWWIARKYERMEIS